jgi:hypothetical protein
MCSWPFMNGHEHIYERLMDDGMLFLLAGAAGGKSPIPWPWYDEHSLFRYMYLRSVTLVEVSPVGGIHLKTWSGSDGKVADEYSF